MTTIIQDPNKTGWTLPQTLRQGSNFTDSAGRTGIVNFDVNTGKPLTQNQTTIIPSYQNLVANPPASGGTVPAPLAPTTPVSPKIMSFTQALIQILKDAQGANTKGQAGLMQQSNQIKGLGLNDATTNFSNPLLTPSSGTSLGMSAQNEFDPSLNSIADQQKLASQNLGNITDLVNMTGDNYQKEQNRLLRIEEKKQDAIEKAKDRAASAANKSSDNNMTTDVLNAVQQFQLIKKTKNWRGVSPDDYQDMVAYFQKEYGVEGVSKLKTAMNALDLKVDDGTEDGVDWSKE